MRPCTIAMAVVTTLALLTGCGDSEPSAAAAAGGAADQTGEWEAVDWGAVEPADSGEIANVMSQLARYVDAWHHGEREQVTLFCDKSGRVADRFGNAGDITLGEWKLYLENVRGTPKGRTAARTMPAASFDHEDGLGEVPRFAYFVEEGEIEGSLLFTMVKELDGVSGG